MGLLLRFFMNSTIELKHKPSIVAIEVRNIRPNRYLPAEFEAKELPIAQPFP
jgi:hypothetical protein